MADSKYTDHVNSVDLIVDTTSIRVHYTIVKGSGGFLRRGKKKYNIVDIYCGNKNITMLLLPNHRRSVYRILSEQLKANAL